MKGMNIIKIDSKGRVLIPSYLRKTMGLAEGSEIIVVKDEDELKMFPLYRGMNAKMKIMLKDMPGALSSVSGIIAKHNCNIIISTTTPMEKNLTEWSAIIQAKDLNALPKLKKVLLESEFVERVKMFY